MRQKSIIYYIIRSVLSISKQFSRRAQQLNEITRPMRRAGDHAVARQRERKSGKNNFAVAEKERCGRENEREVRGIYRYSRGCFDGITFATARGENKNLKKRRAAASCFNGYF